MAMALLAPAGFASFGAHGSQETAGPCDEEPPDPPELSICRKNLHRTVPTKGQTSQLFDFIKEELLGTHPASPPSPPRVMWCQGQRRCGGIEVWR